MNPPKGSTKKIEIIQEKSSSLFSIPDLKEVNTNSKVFDKFTTFENFPVICNVAFLIECILGHLVIHHGFKPEQIKQNFETHRILMTVLSSQNFRFFFAVIASFGAFPYLDIYTIDEMYRYIDDYTRSNLKGAKKILLPKNSTKEAGDKAIKGKILSVKGLLSSHPLFYPLKLENFYGISLKNPSIETINKGFPFPEHQQKAVNFLFETFNGKNIIDLTINVSVLEEQLGIKWNSLTRENEVLIEDDLSLDPEEREMIRKINLL